MIEELFMLMVKELLKYFDIPLQAKLREEEEDREAKRVFYPEWVILERLAKE